MHALPLAFGISAFALGTLALPTAWARLDPPPSLYDWHNTAVTVTIEASGGSGLRVCYRLNGGDPVCQTPPATLTLASEGLHALEYWAVDDSGESPHQRLTVRIDLTPPIIRIHSPIRDSKYLLHQSVRADWFAYDRLSGLDFVEASVESGATVDTTSPGFQTFFVVARDRAGNMAREEAGYQVICVVETVLPTGFFLDRLLPPEEQVPLGKLPVKARYVQGESIVLAFRLRDALGQAGPWTRPNLLLTQVRPDPEFGEKHTIWAWLVIPYDEEADFYRLIYDTGQREPGVYDLWLGFGDGQNERIRIEILPKL